MTHKKTFRFARLTLAAALFVAGAGMAWAAEAPSSAMAPTKEMRAQMATVHEQMAACLRTDRPVADCHAEMMKACQSMAPGKGCQMGPRGMGPRSGMGKGRRAGPGAAPAAPAAPAGK